MTQKEALALLKTGQSAFITGPAGSGKTHVIREYITYLNEKGASVGITASTGIAATHIGGSTIHSWAGIGIKDALSKNDVIEIAEKSYLKNRLKYTHVLVLDEISMLHHFRLDLVDRVLRQARESDIPFGGAQVILSGDFFQLPPVTRRGEREAHFAYHSTAWKELEPAVCYLEEQHRQNDVPFLNVLNELRTGEVSSDTRSVLHSRLGTKPDTGDQPTKLYTHNQDVDRENHQELENIEGTVHEYSMYTKGKDVLVDMLKKGCLTPETLYLKEGARVMFVKNNFEAGYANGTLGVVTSCSANAIVVETRQGKVIEVERESWHIEDNGKVLAEITQYPLRLAWAITVHKSQGMSLDAAYIDLSNSFEKGMGYVALSRVRTLDGLFLKGLNDNALLVHDEVLDMDAVFRESSEKSAEHIRSLSKKVIDGLHYEYVQQIESSGGGVKKDTRTQTKELLEQGLSIAEMARERNLKPETIIQHIEELKEDDPALSIGHIRKSIPVSRFKRIAQAFAKAGVVEGGKRPLAPVKTILGNSFSYEEIRIVRLFL